jgi:methyl-accepting chemotaxis protein
MARKADLTEGMGVTMDILRRLGLQRRFQILSLFLAVVVLIESGIVLINSMHTKQQSVHLSETQVPLLSGAHDLKFYVLQVQQWLSDISATRGRDGLDDGFTAAEKNAKLFRAQIERLIALDAKHAARYRAMLPVFNEYYKIGTKMAQVYIDDGPAGGNRMMPAFDKVAERLSTQVDGFLAQMEDATHTTIMRQEGVESTTSLSVVFGSLAILLGIGIIYFIMSRALACLPVILGEMQRISDGDLTGEIAITRQDEIGGLMQGLQSMKQRLMEIVAKINQTTARLSTAADDLSVVTNQTSGNIRTQQGETEQIATSMSEMSATVREVAQNVSSASEAASAANAETENGQQVVEAAVEGIQRLAAQIENTSLVIAQLERDSETISRVLEVIRGVAEQTNLLALNAAIETARAGEQGRGFAVVADEVRTLAGRTQASTAEINGIIEQLQTGSRNTVQVMQQSREQAKSAVEKAVLAGTSLQTIARSVSQINAMSAQIATTAEQQSAVTEDMNKSIVRINDMALQNAGFIGAILPVHV